MAIKKKSIKEVKFYIVGKFTSLTALSNSQTILVDHIG